MEFRSISLYYKRLIYAYYFYNQKVNMKYCVNCGHKIEDHAKFCEKCGYHVTEQTQRHRQSDYHTKDFVGKPQNKESLIDKLNRYIGNNKQADLNWKVLFTDVFTRHTNKEAEEIFICGTYKTTPDETNISKNWPHPWLYSRVLFLFLSTFLMLWICCVVFENRNTLPGMIIIGSFAVPLATMVLFLEMNVWRNVSIFTVIKTFLIGGCASLVATLILFSIYEVDELDFGGAFMTGVIEEVGKLVIVYYFVKKMKKISILSSMLIGACVGAGFAAFESAGYATQVPGMNNIVTSLFVRGLLAPGGHVAWAAMSGAALAIAAKMKGGISSNILTDGRFLKIFILPIVLHAAWDSPLSTIGQEFFLMYTLYIIIAWVILLILFNMGLAETEQINQ